MRPARYKLCIVSPFEHGGGAEYQISLLIDALAAMDRFEIHYLTHFVDERARARAYTVTRIGEGGQIPRLGYLSEGRALYRKLDELRPDAIYQRVACGYTGVCALFARRRAIPLTWHVAHDSDVSPRHLDSGRNVVRIHLEKSAVRFAARNATRIVVQSANQSRLLQQHYARTPAAVIPNFHPNATQLLDKSGALTVVWIANMKRWKRPEVFVQLANALRDLAHVRFLMVGSEAAGAGNRAWQRQLLRMIGETPNLSFLGAKTHEEVNQLLARSHVFVNTSVQEGFPNTFIQAWLHDVAVVSLSVDPDEILRHEAVGICAGTEVALNEAVRRLVVDEPLRAAYVQRGRDHALRHHSLRNAQELIRVIGP